MKKSIASLLAVCTAFSLAPLTFLSTSCSKKDDVSDYDENKRRLTWKLDNGVSSVSVDGYEEPPTNVDLGTTIKFKVNLKEGCNINTVKINKRKTEPDADGFYHIEVKKNITTIVKTTETVHELVIEQKPNVMIYYDGDKLNTDGLVVKAKYLSGNEEILSKVTALEDGYSVSYEKEDQKAFKLGDTKFIVSYGGVTKDVVLDDQVYLKGVIDAKGARMSDSYIATIESKNLYGYRINEEKSQITFSFDIDVTDSDGNVTYTGKHKLTEDIPAPAESDLTKEGFEFVSFSGDKIAKESNSNTTISAKWKAILVQISKLEAKMIDNTPYLVITGKYLMSAKTRLELVEKLNSGVINGKVIGDTFQGTPGSDLEVKFDLSKLPSAKRSAGGTFATKWFSIRFVSGTDLDDPTTCSYIDLLDDGSIDFDKTARLRTGDKKYTYLFTTFTYNGAKTIQIFYVVNTMIYTTEFKTVNGVESFVVNGEFLDSKYFNKVIDFGTKQARSTTGKDLSYANNYYITNIDSLGKFEVAIPLKDFISNAQTWFPYYVYNDNVSTTYILKGNLIPPEGDTTYPTLNEQKIGITQKGATHYLKNAISYTSTDNVTFYCGYYLAGTDGYVMVYAKDPNATTMSYKVTNFDLQNINNQITFVISGTYTGTYHRQVVYLDFEHSEYWEGKNNTTTGQTKFPYVYYTSLDSTFTPPVADASNGTFTIKANVEIDGLAKENRKSMLIPHFGINKKVDMTGFSSSNITSNTFDKNGFTYSLSIGQVLASNGTWGKDVPSVKIVPTALQG